MVEHSPKNPRKRGKKPPLPPPQFISAVYLPVVVSSGSQMARASRKKNSAILRIRFQVLQSSLASKTSQSALAGSKLLRMSTRPAPKPNEI